MNILTRRVALVVILAMLWATCCCEGARAGAQNERSDPAQADVSARGGPRVEDPEVTMVLARPIFAPGRRPDLPELAHAVSGDVASVPRLTGILVDGATRRAIFAAPARPGGSETVWEGGRIGAYAVQTIGLAAVTITGPGGVQTLTPRFASGLAAAPALPVMPPTVGAQMPLKLGPERFEAPVGPMGLAMYRYSPAAPHAPLPVPDALTAP